MTICSKYVLFLWTLVSICGCSGINESIGLRDENIYEELIEKIIESQIGLPSGMIDLTPSSPENLT